MNSVIRPLIILSGLAVLLLPFQNCTSATFGDATSGQQKSGNGDGYTGKVYVELGLCGTDPTPVVKTVLRVLSNINEAEVIRENCEDIVPRAVDPNEIQTVPSGTHELIYRGQSLVEDVSQPVVDRVGPDCQNGRCVMVTGSNLCQLGLPLNLSYAVPAHGTTPASGFQPYSPVRTECLAGGSALLVEFSASFYIGNPLNVDWVATPAIILRVRQPGNPPAVFQFRQARFAQPSIRTITSCGTNCLSIDGDFFGQCGVVTVSHPHMSAPVNPVVTSCTRTRITFDTTNVFLAQIYGTGPVVGGSIAGVSPVTGGSTPPPYVIEVNNGIKSVSSTYTP